jgi:hypothetical protein
VDETRYEHGLEYLSCREHTEADLCAKLDALKNQGGWDLAGLAVVMRHPKVAGGPPDPSWMLVLRRPARPAPPVLVPDFGVRDSPN